MQKSSLKLSFQCRSEGKKQVPGNGYLCYFKCKMEQLAASKDLRPSDYFRHALEFLIFIFFIQVRKTLDNC